MHPLVTTTMAIYRVTSDPIGTYTYTHHILLTPYRKNPYKNDFEPIETPYITNLLGETVLGDLQESSVTCDSVRYSTTLFSSLAT